MRLSTRNAAIAVVALVTVSSGCKTNDPATDSASSSVDSLSSIDQVVREFDICSFARTYAKTPAAARIPVPRIDQEVQRLLRATSADTMLVDATPKARFDYLKQLALDAHDFINSRLAQRLANERAVKAALQGYNAESYLDQPPTASDVSSAPDAGYWRNETAGICQDCSTETLSLVNKVLSTKLNELRSCTWDGEGGGEGPEMSLTGGEPPQAVKDLIDFIKSENKAEKLCDIGLYYSFGDNAKCTHSYVQSSCEEFLTEGKKPALDDQGKEKLKGVLESCVTAYGGERAGRAARIAIDKFHNALKDGDSYAQAAAEAACAGGAALVGERIQSTPQLDFEHACRDLSPFSRGFFTKERAAACFNTSASICRIAFTSGSLGVYEAVPGGKSIAHDQARKLIYAAEGALCRKSLTTSLACNAINESGKQIYQAITTGNNDWAHCVGTDKLGACLGNLYGSKGWTNNNGVQMAQQTSDGSTYRGCCWCKKKYYANDKWIAKDTMFRSENWFGVIQQGDVKSGNCGFREGKVIKNQPLTYNGHDVYYKYEDCNKWYVAGDQCAVVNGTTHQVWNGGNKSWFPVTVP